MDPDILADLATSGLIPEDINAQAAGPPELAAVKVSSSNARGYKIPYYTLEGQPLPFYRVKLFDQHPKYKQPRNSENYVYYPPDLLGALGEMMVARDPPYFLLLTEGEKKAAAAVKVGIPAIAFSGVDSWRTKTFTVPDESKMETSIFGKTKQVRIRLPSTDIDFVENLTLAQGMKELIDLLIRRDLNAIIVYDTDATTDKGGVKSQVQRAAATLGYELRFRGVPFTHIRQLILPNDGIKLEKVGLDDFLVAKGKDTLQKLIDQTLAVPSAFPRHPSPRTYVNQRLNRRLSRKESQNVSLAILTELDCRGQRLNCKGTNTPYYFDRITKRLMPAVLLKQREDPMHETPFGHFLYREFNLSAADTRVLHWLASQFTGELPIQSVDPRRVLSVPDGSDEVAVQIGDGQFALVTANSKESESLQVLDNGSKGLLFEFDQVESMDGDELLSEFRKQKREKVLKPWWYDVLGTVRLTESNLWAGQPEKQGSERSRILATLLFYLSPWLNRWRGTQLPIELMIGEAGSGKSSLYILRQNIITGRPYLRNAPADLKDWYSSVIHSGGINVIDNVQFVNKDLRQRLSDELCRITTEPYPHIEMRKLYTTATQIQIPVRVNFAMTAIQQPFFNADLIQRAAIFELSQITEGIDGSWVDHQIERYGGRTRWLAHHLVVLHKFLHAVVHSGAWDHEYQASHRLVNYEQCLLVMGDVLGLDVDWIPEVLNTAAQTNLTEADWTMEGLKVFADEMRKERANASRVQVTASDIAQWASENDEYSDNNMLTNTRRIGRYIQAHKSTVKRITGIHLGGLYGNRRQYIIGDAR
jgi:hypothetical protein